MVTDHTRQRAWATFILPIASPHIFGAACRSERLHWTFAEAVKEAEHFAASLGRNEKIEWVVRDEQDEDIYAFGRIPGYGIVVASMLLPLGEPPRKS
jgi:hypothetical protein